MRTCNDIVQKGCKVQPSQYTIINSSKEEISFICDGKDDNVITLKPDQMITDVYSFTPVILDQTSKKPIESYCSRVWTTYSMDHYKVNHKYSLTSTWAASRLNLEITIDVMRVDFSN